MKKSLVLLLLLTAVLCFSCSEVLAASTTDIQLMSVRIINEGMVNYDYISAYHEKTPANANGTFVYVWRSSNESVAHVVVPPGTDGGGRIRVYPGYMDGEATITLTVTQTMPSGATATVSNSYTDHSRNYGYDNFGCNVAVGGTGYALITFMTLLLFFGTKSRDEKNK